MPFLKNSDSNVLATDVEVAALQRNLQLAIKEMINSIKSNNPNNPKVKNAIRAGEHYLYTFKNECLDTLRLELENKTPNTLLTEFVMYDYDRGGNLTRTRRVKIRNSKEYANMILLQAGKVIKDAAKNDVNISDTILKYQKQSIRQMTNNDKFVEQFFTVKEEDKETVNATMDSILSTLAKKELTNKNLTRHFDKERITKLLDDYLSFAVYYDYYDKQKRGNKYKARFKAYENMINIEKNALNQYANKEDEISKKIMKDHSALVVEILKDMINNIAIEYKKSRSFIRKMKMDKNQDIDDLTMQYMADSPLVKKLYKATNVLALTDDQQNELIHYIDNKKLISIFTYDKNVEPTTTFKIFKMYKDAKEILPRLEKSLQANDKNNSDSSKSYQDFLTSLHKITTETFDDPQKLVTEFATLGINAGNYLERHFNPKNTIEQYRFDKVMEVLKIAMPPQLNEYQKDINKNRAAAHLPKLFFSQTKDIAISNIDALKKVTNDYKLIFKRLETQYGASNNYKKVYKLIDDFTSVSENNKNDLTKKIQQLQNGLLDCVLPEIENTTGSTYSKVHKCFELMEAIENTAQEEKIQLNNKAVKIAFSIYHDDLVPNTKKIYPAETIPAFHELCKNALNNFTASQEYKINENKYSEMISALEAVINVDPKEIHFASFAEKVDNLSKTLGKSNHPEIKQLLKATKVVKKSFDNRRTWFKNLVDKNYGEVNPNKKSVYFVIENNKIKKYISSNKPVDLNTNIKTFHASEYKDKAQIQTAVIKLFKNTYNNIRNIDKDKLIKFDKYGNPNGSKKFNRLVRSLEDLIDTQKADYEVFKYAFEAVHKNIVDYCYTSNGTRVYNAIKDVYFNMNAISNTIAGVENSIESYNFLSEDAKRKIEGKEPVTFTSFDNNAILINENGKVNKNNNILEESGSSINSLSESNDNIISTSSKNRKNSKSNRSSLNIDAKNNNEFLPK